MTRDILYVIDTLERGGAETHLLRVLPLLNNEQNRCHVFLTFGGGEFINQFAKHNIKVTSPWLPANGKPGWLKPFCLLLTLFQLSGVLMFQRPDIAHFFLPRSYLLGAPLCWLFRISTRIMSRRSLNDYQNSYPALVRKIETALHRTCHCLLGNANAVVRQLIEDEDVSPSKTKLIYNGIPTQAAACPSLRRSDLNLGEESFVMVIIANLIPYKGHLDLLDALACFPENLPKWDLLIVGADPAGHKANLVAKSNALGLTQQVHFLGKRDDVPALLKLSDLALLTSHEEGFSNAILEAMQAGKPVVATDVGGNKEAVVHNQTGLIVPAKNPQALSNALVCLITDQEKSEGFGKAGRARLLQHFSMDACVAQYQALYDQFTPRERL